MRKIEIYESLIVVGTLFLYQLTVPVFQLIFGDKLGFIVWIIPLFVIIPMLFTINLERYFTKKALKKLLKISRHYGIANGINSD